MAITWRTVSGDGGGGAAALTNSGSRLVMDGLNNIQKLAADQQQLNVLNNKIVSQRNTDDYLDQVAQISSAADISDPTVQQGLMALRQGYGQMINRDATRNAIDQRRLDLQKQEVAANAFADQATERAQRPLIEQITAAGRAGDKATVNRLLDENSFINEDQVAKAADQSLDAVTNRQYAAAGQERAQRAEGRAVEQFNLSKQIQQANMQDRLEQRQEKKDERLLKAADLELKGQEALLRASNPLANTSTDPLKDANALVGKVADDIAPWFNDNAAARNDLTNKFQGWMADGIELGGDLGKVKIPPALIEQYLSQAKEGVFRSRGSLSANADDWIKTYAIANPGLFRQASAVGDQIKELRAQQREVASKSIDMLRGNKLDSVGVSDMIQSLRTGIPTNSRPTTGGLLPERDADTR